MGDDDLELCGLGLLAAAANVVMQLSLPPVGYGVIESTVESGQLFAHPLKRARTTLTYLAVALLGDDADRRRYRRAVDRAHAQVRSTASSPVTYHAFDRDLQLWVAACLYVGLEDVHTRIHGPLDEAAADRCYRGAATLGTTLQVRAGDWPPDRAAFGRYWEERLARVRIDEPVRAYLDAVVGLRHLPRPIPDVCGPAHRFVTRGFLPGPIRAAMGYTWDEGDQRRFDVVVGGLFAAARYVPGVLRRVPFNLLLADMRRRSDAALV